MNFKDLNFDIDITLKKKKTALTNSALYSHDINSVKVNFNVKDEGEPIQEQAKTTVLFTSATQKGEVISGLKATANSTLLDSKTSFDLPPAVTQYEGFVRVDLYLEFENGTQDASESFLIELKRSAIDEGISEVRLIYISEFDELENELKQRVVIADEQVQALKDKISQVEGLKGDSAYQVAVTNGFNGTEQEWLKSLNGLTAYQVAITNGFQGNAVEWLTSLKGAKGATGDKGQDGKGFTIKATFPSLEALEESDKSTFEDGDFVLIASNVEDEDNSKMFVLADNTWKYLTDLSGAQGIQGEKGDKGDTGEKGDAGVSAFEIAQLEGFTGTKEEWVESLKGEQGQSFDSTYLIFVGTNEEWSTLSESEQNKYLLRGVV